jgi:hypothetical protein
MMFTLMVVSEGVPKNGLAGESESGLEVQRVLTGEQEICAAAVV